MADKSRPSRESCGAGRAAAHARLRSSRTGTQQIATPPRISRRHIPIPDIWSGYPEGAGVTRTILFQSNRSQAVRLPEGRCLSRRGARDEDPARRSAAGDRSGERVWDDFFRGPWYRSGGTRSAAAAVARGILGAALHARYQPMHPSLAGSSASPRGSRVCRSTLTPRRMRRKSGWHRSDAAK